MKASIIIRAYDAEKFLERAIENALNQDFPRDEFEIIVVNDGSKDATASILEKYRPHANIRIINQENQGTVRAANRGLAESCGEYIVLLDSDDEFGPTLVRELVVVLDGNQGAEFAYPDYYEEYQGEKKLVTPQNIFQTIAIGTMFRRSALPKESLYREGVFFAEYDLMLRMLGRWHGIHYPRPLMTYHRRSAGMTGNIDRVAAGLRELEELHPDKLDGIRKIRDYTL